MHWILVFFLIAFDHFCKQSTHMPPILKHGFFLFLISFASSILWVFQYFAFIAGCFFHAFLFAFQSLRLSEKKVNLFALCTFSVVDVVVVVVTSSGIFCNNSHSFHVREKFIFLWWLRWLIFLFCVRVPEFLHVW